MGKVLESIGLIDGYDITTIGKLKAKKDKIFEEIEKCDSTIKEKIRKTVNESSGSVFAIVKKGIIKGIYLFEVESKGETRNLRLTKTLYTDEVSQETREKYNEHVLEFAKNYVSTQEYDKVIFNDKVVQVDPGRSPKERALASVGGFAIGFMLGWIIFDSIIGGMLYGIIFAPVFGLDVVVTNKRGRKKKDTSEDTNASDDDNGNNEDDTNKEE